MEGARASFINRLFITDGERELACARGRTRARRRARAHTADLQTVTFLISLVKSSKMSTESRMLMKPRTAECHSARMKMNIC